VQQYWRTISYRAEIRDPRSASPEHPERSTIERVMREMDGNISKAARTVGISRTQLYGRLQYGFSQATI